MQATAKIEVEDEDELLVLQFEQQLSNLRDEAAQREAYRQAFERLRSQMAIYPAEATRPSAVFESAAATMQSLARHCLPLAIAVAMHLYPLCALQCFPLPVMSSARLKRSILLWMVRNRSLVLANAGSERARGADQPVTAVEASGGIRIDGTCEYMSLSSVANVVLLKAVFADGTCALCAADLRGDSVRIGEWKFSGRMRLSDTSSLTFIDHLVPHGRYIRTSVDAGMQCVSDYQRCWFHLVLAEVYLARLEQLRRMHRLPQGEPYRSHRQQVYDLRNRSLRLLDDYSSDDTRPLMKTTSALKLSVSLLAQTTAAELRRLDACTPGESEGLAADATELCHMQWQPTADAKILSSAASLPLFSHPT